MAAARSPRSALARTGAASLLALGLALLPLAAAQAAPAKKASAKTSSSKKAPSKKSSKSGPGHKALAATGASGAAAASAGQGKSHGADVLGPLPAVYTGTLALACSDCPAGMAYELRLQGAEGDPSRGTYRLHRQTVNSLEQTPLESGPWRLSYDYARLILGGGKLPALYAIKDRNTLVQLGIEGKPVEGGQHQLQRVQTSNMPPGPYVPTAQPWVTPGAGQPGLEATTWRLTRLGNASVQTSGQAADWQQQPHFVLQAGEQRVSGSGGCNRFAGSFERDTAQGKVALSGIVSTRVACPEQARTLQEAQFFDALNQTRRYRLTSSTTLELQDEAGAALAQFEAVPAPTR